MTLVLVRTSGRACGDSEWGISQSTANQTSATLVLIKRFPHESFIICGRGHIDLAQGRSNSRPVSKSNCLVAALGCSCGRVPAGRADVVVRRSQPLVIPRRRRVILSLMVVPW
jgi:hypothetical protein